MRTARSHRLWRVTFWSGATVVLFLLFRALAPILAPVAAAAGIAYLLDPLVFWLTRHGWKRSVAAGVVLVGFLVLALAALGVLVPLIARDLGEFAQKVPALIERASVRLEDELGIVVPSDWGGLSERLREGLTQAAKSSGVPVLTSLLGALGSLFAFIGKLLEALLIPMFAFYFLLDWPRLVDRLRALVPPRHQAETLALAGQIDRRIAQWVRGQLTVMFILAALYATALAIIGIPLAIPIGILAGLLSVIPYVGNLVGLVLALLMALLEWKGVPRLVAIAGVFALMNVIEGFVLVPILVGTKVGLSEAGALFAVLVGGHLLGFFGLLLAIPLAAAVDVLVRHGLQYYERSEFYRRAGAEPAPAVTEEVPAP